MKSTLATSIFALAAVLAGSVFTALADPVTETFVEKFNDSQLNPSFWYRYRMGAGRLTVKSGKLSFLVPTNPTDEDPGAAELITRYPGFGDKWEVTVALSNTSDLGKKAGCGLMIAHREDRRDYFYLDFHGKSGVSGGLYSNDRKLQGTIARKSPWTKGWMRIKYAEKVMTLSISPTGESGSWIKIGTFSPTAASAGVPALLHANWNMKPTDAFAIQLFGFSYSTKVPVGKITMDDFNLSVTRSAPVP